MVDTTNILFICSGAFVGLETIVNSRLGKGVSTSSLARVSLIENSQSVSARLSLHHLPTAHPLSSPPILNH